MWAVDERRERVLQDYLPVGFIRLVAKAMCSTFRSCFGGWEVGGGGEGGKGHAPCE